MLDRSPFPRPSAAARAGAVLLAASAACSSSSGVQTDAGPDDGGVADATGQCTVVPAPFSPGVRLFEDRTEAWGLGAIKPEGQRAQAVDFDGDGWPDLVLRRGGNDPDDFAPGGKRMTWLLRNNHQGGFEDVSESSGYRAMRTGVAGRGRPAELVVWGDVDNDGYLDAYTGVLDGGAKLLGETSEIVYGGPDGRFTLGPADAPYRIAKGEQPYGAVFTDFDRDGNLDLFVAENAQQSRLYRGDGKRGFVEVTAEMGLSTKSWSDASVEDLNAGLGHAVSWAATACDLNGDGNPELLVSSYGRAPNHLWQSLGMEGAFKFANRSVASGYAYDDRQDWTDNESARCWCKLHPTDDECDKAPPPRIKCSTNADAFRWNHKEDRNAFRLGGNSGSTACADVDNDGRLDLVTSEIVHWDVGSSSDPAELLLGEAGPDAHFTRPGNEATGLVRAHGETWDEGIQTNSVLDFDNDGWPDLYLGASDYDDNRGLLFHQDAPGHFQPVPMTDGIDQHRSHSSAVADFDRDGDLDIVVGHGLARCSKDPADTAPCYPTAQFKLFENVGPPANFVQLSLEGAPGSNRAAIGARVTVEAGGVTQTHEVGGGYGQLGQQDDLLQHFGLGAACQAEITIRWPDAALTIETFTLAAGQRYRIKQGEAAVVVGR